VILTVLLLGLLCCICGNGLVRGVDLGLFSMKGYRVVDVAVAGIPNGTCCLRGSVTRALLDQVFVDVGTTVVVVVAQKTAWGSP